MNRLSDIQRRWNLQSADHWRLATEHRQRVMQLIETHAPAIGGRVCILGAGNGNDLDLPRLLRRFASVGLLDLDQEALARAAARQGVAGDAGLKLHGGCDLTGIFAELSELKPGRASAAMVEALIAAALQPSLPEVDGPFDLVVSTCVLSQLIHGVADAVGESHPRFVDLLAAVRSGHLRLLTDLTAPGGWTVLITDFVSSDSAPEIATAPEEQLERLARDLLDRRNFFHGLNPAVLASLWLRDPYLSAAVANLEVTPPWRWNFGLRHYLVTAFSVQKRREPENA